MSRLPLLQSLSVALGGACALLGLLAANGCRVVEAGEPSWASFLYPALFVFGLAAGIAAVVRGREVERRRWRQVQEPGLTSGEREYAHKEAESQRRWATTAFAVAPICLGYWLAYQTRGEADHTLTNLLIAAPVVGFAAGLWVGRRLAPDPKPEL